MTAPSRSSPAPTKRRVNTSAAFETQNKPSTNTSTVVEPSRSTQVSMPRQILRYCAVTLVVTALAFGASSVFPAVQSAVLWGKALAGKTELSSVRAAHNVPPSTGRPSVEVLATYPHDLQAFTQGLLVVQGGNEKFFIESTGLYSESSLRKVNIDTGEVVSKYDLPSSVFGEGVTLGPDGELVMITWKAKKGYTFMMETTSEGRSQFILKSEFEFKTSTGEGWGIDYDGVHLVVSDGSSKIMFWDPKTKTELREITVSYNGEEVHYLNELEFANGFIYANVWYNNVIIKIDPTNGNIVTVFDCSNIVAQSGADPGNSGAVLNGIAYDGDEDVFYITGKQWGRVFKVRLLE